MLWFLIGVGLVVVVVAVRDRLRRPDLRRSRTPAPGSRAVATTPTGRGPGTAEGARAATTAAPPGSARESPDRGCRVRGHDCAAPPDPRE